jgi:hypothetical protein
VVPDIGNLENDNGRSEIVFRKNAVDRVGYVVGCERICKSESNMTKKEEAGHRDSGPASTVKTTGFYIFFFGKFNFVTFLN